ncbi:MAG: DNA methyltransferase [Blastocatellales bacterium]
MTNSHIDSQSITDFIARWESSGAAERANYQLFLSELCDLLGVDRPAPTQPDDAMNSYVFERSVTFQNGDGTTSTGRIDLYKRGCFILEAKQGSEKEENAGKQSLLDDPIKMKKGVAVRGSKSWDDAMIRARGQAEQYARALPANEGWPVFLITADIGHTIELYADFTRLGKTYLPFPDAQSHRLKLDDLQNDEIRQRLRAVWTEPLSLDPSRRSARVTREVAAKLALLARSFEQSGHAPETVAAFLMRCLFTMFAEDVHLIPAGKFTGLLESRRKKLSTFKPMLEALWETMNTGGFSTILEEHVLRFNGGLFENCEALPVNAEQLELLIEAGRCDWREVEPAIFGTLLERALDPIERHKLGAHYTPRAYVERLVLPTVIEPLREEWKNVLAAAVTLAQSGNLKAAADEVRSFHRRLCEVRVLDPACGSGNFLYVTLEHLKRLEGEVINALQDFDDRQAVFEIEGFTVDPHQLLGIEINPRAAAIADLVLWIGYLQWHFRTRGDAKPAEPVLRKFQNIECRDAVLAYDAIEEVVGEDSRPVTRWDGRTMKKHPVTGEDVPDESARVPIYRYINPRKAEWPKADYVVGNPPFIGTARMRAALGDGYTETLRKVYTKVPESCDYVMYWWDRAAELARHGEINHFGLIATNSLRQTFNRRVIQRHLDDKQPLSLRFAIPDHPWVDSADGAAVRISMTVGEKGDQNGILYSLTQESVSGPVLNPKLNTSFNTFTNDDSVNVELIGYIGKIFADLTMGVNLTGSQPLQSNILLSNRGMMLFGAGFIVTKDEANLLGLGRVPGLEKHIRPYLNGRDLTGILRDVMVIDLFGLTADQVRNWFPEVYQRVLQRVKPERDQNRDENIKRNWWLFGRPRPELRDALNGLKRFIATVETSKHRFFVFLDESILPDNMLVNIALDDACFLGVLSSRIHIVWALAAGGRLGVGNDPRYNKTRCFDTFPFPVCSDSDKERIRALGEQLDAHRRRQQELHPGLTITEMYNVLEKLRSGESLTEKERTIHEQGLISVLRQIHDELDDAVADAYGWPRTLSDEEILQRLVDLNAERAREERTGLIRWLRPDYQNKSGVQTTIETGTDEPVTIEKPVRKVTRRPWPKSLPEQASALRSALAEQPGVTTAENIVRSFSGARTDTVARLLDTLVSLGLAREVEPGRYTT